jgi:raffinose/stachyose/melibiose transport system permease protein
MELSLFSRQRTGRAALRVAHPRHNRSREGLGTVLLFLPPALMVFTLFVVLPIGESAWFSLFDWNGYGRPEHFVGLRNYIRLFGFPPFRTALLNNAMIIAVSVLIQLPVAIAAGVLLSGRGRAVVFMRLVFFLPYILAEVAAGLIWRFAFDGNFGLVAAAARGLGLDAPFMLADPSLARVALIVVVVWKYFGFHMMLVIAGMQGIDAELWQAARMDGASGWQSFRHITLPLLWPTIRVSVFFSVIGSLQLFDVVMPLTGGGPGNATQTMATFLYSFGITRMKIGFGSAVGVVLFVISASFALLYSRIFLRDA